MYLKNFSHIYVEKRVLSHPFTKEILSKFPKSEIIASLTAGLGIFSLAISGIEFLNHLWCSFNFVKILFYLFLPLN